MIEFDYVPNDNKIFDEDYMYKTVLKGYMINNKYPDGNFTEQEIILFLESHSKKYQFKINYFIKNNKLDSVDLIIDKVSSYDIPIYKRGIVDQFYYNVEDEIIKFCPLDKLDKNTQITFLEHELASPDGNCIVSNNYMVLLQDIGTDKRPFITKNHDVNITNMDFATKILKENELKEYKEKYYMNS